MHFKLKLESFSIFHIICIHNFLAKTPALERPMKLFIFVLFASFPQVAFPCKMPDMTPEGNLGVGEAPQGAAQGLKYKLEGRAQVGQARDSTRDMASGRDQRFVFVQEAVSTGQGARILGEEEVSPSTLGGTHIPRE